MSLAAQIATTAARLMQHRAGSYAERALHVAQRSAVEAAKRIEAAGPRIATLAEAGLKLAEITCRCADQLIRQGIVSAQGALADGAERLRLTGKARNLGTLYASQLAALPATRRRVAHDLEASWRIVTSASRDLVALVRSTRGELTHNPARVHERKSRRRTGTRARRATT